MQERIESDCIYLIRHPTLNLTISFMNLRQFWLNVLYMLGLYSVIFLLHCMVQFKLLIGHLIFTGCLSNQKDGFPWQFHVKYLFSPTYSIKGFIK